MQEIRYEPVGLEEALNMSAMTRAGYRYIWYQEQSRVGICRLEDYQPDRQHLIEAILFTDVGENEPASQVHIFYGQDGRCVAERTVADGTMRYTEERQLLLPIYGKSLTLRTVYTYDEDGQAMPGAVLLTGYEEEA